MTIVSSLGIVFVLSITVAIPACAPPTPKVERPAPSSHRESGPHSPGSNSEGSLGVLLLISIKKTAFAIRERLLG